MSREQVHSLCQVEGWRVVAEAGQWIRVERGSREEIIHIDEEERPARPSDAPR